MVLPNKSLLGPFIDTDKSSRDFSFVQHHYYCSSCSSSCAGIHYSDFSTSYHFQSEIQNFKWLNFFWLASSNSIIQNTQSALYTVSRWIPIDCAVSSSSFISDLVAWIKLKEVNIVWCSRPTLHCSARDSPELNPKHMVLCNTVSSMSIFLFVGIWETLRFNGRSLSWAQARME